MKISTKWTTVSFFGAAAVVAGTFAFAGCTVTSGTVDNKEGGAGNPTDGGGALGDGSPQSDTGTAVTCEGNKQPPDVVFVSPACNAKVQAVCCTELKTCFDIVPSDAGAEQSDCTALLKCLGFANQQPTDADKLAAEKECKDITPQNVKDALTAINACSDSKAAAECVQ